MTITTTATFEVTNVSDNMEDTAACLLTVSGTSVQIPLTLWGGPDYVSVGQWTNDSVVDRVKDLLARGVSS